MVATAAEFQKKQPDVRITWQKRSLKEFGDFPIDRLAETFDLLVIDHPFVGTAAATGCILPLDKYIDENFLAEQRRTPSAGITPAIVTPVTNGRWRLMLPGKLAPTALT